MSSVALAVESDIMTNFVRYARGECEGKLINGIMVRLSLPGVKGKAFIFFTKETHYIFESDGKRVSCSRGPFEHYTFTDNGDELHYYEVFTGTRMMLCASANVHDIKVPTHIPLGKFLQQILQGTGISVKEVMAGATQNVAPENAVAEKV